MSVDDLLRVWRVVVLGIGAFDMGFALVMAYVYVRGHKDPGPYHKVRHVLAITASYVILCAGLWGFIFDRAVNGDSITYRLLLATVAWPLGIYALTQLLRHAQRGDNDARSR